MTILDFDRETILKVREDFIPRLNALAMNIYYQPILKLREQLEQHLGQKLIYSKSWCALGEAHITILTPPEISKLQSFISLDKINLLAQKMQIQNAIFQILDLGRGELEIDSKIEKTFFIILKSDDLLQIRKAVYRAFLNKGGEAHLFNPDKFYPHITVGYTLRDLHESDGVIKDLEQSKDPVFSINS